MNTLKIGKHKIGLNQPVYIIAEISANHNKDFNKAVELIHLAKDAGANAVKLQTYTPDTITLNCHNKYFKIKGTIWKEKYLYDLYNEAYMPWEWQPKLKKIADMIGIDLFSTAFDFSSVDFLEKMQVPAYKVASFELVDIPLITKIARTKKPVILSTGMATENEIFDAVKAVKAEGNHQIALLKCTSEYPADPADMNLKTIQDMIDTFKTVIGLSDHTLGITIPIVAVSLGAKIIEKHFTLSRKESGPDSAFSLEPKELKEMVKEIRTAEKAIGKVSYTFTKKEKSSRALRRSLFAVKDISKGEILNEENIKSIRPAYGLEPKLFYKVIGKKASKNIKKGTPISLKMIDV